MTDTQNHTPSPWRADPVYNGNKIVSHILYKGEHQGSFAIIENKGALGACTSNDTARANAKLIAASPDMLSVLESLKKLFTDGDLNNAENRRGALYVIESAINKANGK